MVSAAGEAQREPVKRAAAAGEMRFEPDRPGRVVHRPVDGRPAGVVQRCGVHAIAVGGRRPTAADGDRDQCERPRQQRGERQHDDGLETDGLETDGLVTDGGAGREPTTRRSRSLHAPHHGLVPVRTVV